MLPWLTFQQRSEIRYLNFYFIFYSNYKYICLLIEEISNKHQCIQSQRNYCTKTTEYLEKPRYKYFLKQEMEGFFLKTGSAAQNVCYGAVYCIFLRLQLTINLSVNVSYVNNSFVIILANETIYCILETRLKNSLS